MAQVVSAKVLGVTLRTVRLAMGFPVPPFGVDVFQLTSELLGNIQALRPEQSHVEPFQSYEREQLPTPQPFLSTLSGSPGHEQ